MRTPCEIVVLTGIGPIGIENHRLSWLQMQTFREKRLKRDDKTKKWIVMATRPIFEKMLGVRMTSVTFSLVFPITRTFYTHHLSRSYPLSSTQVDNFPIGTCRGQPRSSQDDKIYDSSVLNIFIPNPILKSLETKHYKQPPGQDEWLYPVARNCLLTL